ncbi:MAG TPA: aldo/keto reductase, partial [Ramlibacter sp.]|nr:aldo/keto reductase [Ramlibacter sp.]
MNITFQTPFERSFGTFPLKGEALADALHTALDVGYRAIDTAQMYGNEADVGEALRCAAVPRSQLCISTKVHPDNFTAARFLPSVEDSLKKLRVDFVDVLMLHWPPMGGDVTPSLKLLEKAAQAGLARHIGVSNYTPAMMETARSALDTTIVTNQVEFHPLLDQSAMLRAATRTGIPLSSYCSVARGEVFKHSIFDDIAKTYGRSAAQVVLRWILQKGVAINTMSTQRANIEANFNVMDFTLSSVDMDRIDAMTKTGYRIVDKRRAPWSPDWDA